MTPIDKCFMLEISTKLNFDTLKQVYSSGHSRIPIYDRHKDNIVGILMARDLILINPDKAMMTLRQLSSILMKDVICCNETDAIEPVMYYFKKGLSHMSIVTKTIENKNLDPTQSVVGIVTMEDIIEELIQEEIEDEADEDTKDRNILRE